MTPELEALNQKTRERLENARKELEAILAGQVMISTAEIIAVALGHIKVAERKHSESPIRCEVCGDLCEPKST